MNSFIIIIFIINFLLNTVTLKSILRENEENSDDHFIRKIGMKNAVSSQPDDLRCTYIKVDSTKRQYILGYVPHSDKRVAHHMVLFGCKKPAVIFDEPENENWFCGIGSVGICEKEKNQNSENIIYAWALNAGELKFPEDTGMRIGGDTDIQYLVLQMHYKDEFEDGTVDNSGLSIKLTNEEMPYQVGLFVLGNTGYIPPHRKEFYMESGCRYKYPFEIVPFAYRVHAHNLGRVISAYALKNNNEAIEIGRMSPQQPQLFYNVTNSGIVIDQSYTLISKCTMNSMSRNENTYMGPRNHDEMCNFYILYYTNYPGNLMDTFCFKDAQNFSWEKDLDVKLELKSSSSLDGVLLLEPGNEMNMEMSHDI